MKVLPQKDSSNINQVMSVNKEMLTRLADLAFECSLLDDVNDVRRKLYHSDYKPSGLEDKEAALQDYLDSIDSSHFSTFDQDIYYKWININDGIDYKISYRYYLSPNPNNMHKMVEELVKAFTENNVAVRFKYQLTSNMKYCDRIIIYSDVENREKIKNAIQTVYKKNPMLFQDCERPAAWFYEAGVPNVFIAPETPGDAYSNAVSQAIIDAKRVFSYYYGLTTQNSRIKLTEVEYDDMRTILASILLKKGLLFSTDKRFINFKEKRLSTGYNWDTGELRLFIVDSNGCDEAFFSQTPEGKQAFVNNFYNILSLGTQNGVKRNHFSPEEWKKELYARLYPHLVENGTNKFGR